jgi:predicted PurR-regulated permease PerM
MDDDKVNSTGDPVLAKTLNLLIRIGLIFGLLIWCFLILQPFLMIVLWGLIIAVSVYPFFSWLKTLLGNRGVLAATLITLLMLGIMLVPFFFMAQSLFDGISYLKGLLDGGKFDVPTPPESVKNWPIIGNTVYQTWVSADQNLASVILQFQPQIRAFLSWLLSAVASAGAGLLKFIISIIVSGVLLALAKSGGNFFYELFVRLAGKRGNEFADSIINTIRSVTKGILGVALIQSFLAGAGFLVAGVPAAGLWALIALFLAIIQIGVGPVCIVVVIYMFFQASTVTAVALMVWCILVTLTDNVLKPIMLGRGSTSPMLVIFLGAIGGFLLSGIIGLFVGAVILSLGYNLFMIWLRELKEDENM